MGEWGKILGLSGLIGTVFTALLKFWTDHTAVRAIRDGTTIDKYEVLDAKQEQIAEWGFRAAEDANKRADRIAAEAQMQVAGLQEQLNELRKSLDAQVAAMREMRAAYEGQIKQMQETHQREIDERNRRIYRLEDALGAVREDRQRQTREGERQTAEGVRQTAEGERQTREGGRLKRDDGARGEEEEQ